MLAEGRRVGLMDADVYGPNVPLMLGTGYDQPEVENGQLVPIEAHGIKMISMAVLVPRDKPMILRGPSTSKSEETMFPADLELIKKFDAGPYPTEIWYLRR